jgi:HlyD family secretion protein
MPANTSQYKQWLVPGVVAIFIAVIIIYATRTNPIPVESASIEARTLTILVEEQGRTRARDPYLVAAPITGRLLRSELDEGNHVNRGQVISRIALPPEDQRTEAVSRANLTAAEARHIAAEAILMEAESSVANARREEERRGELLKNNLISQEELEYYYQVTYSAEARLLSAQATLSAAEAEIESARSRLLGLNQEIDEGVLEVTAPVDGTIYRVYEESERVVTAGSPLFDISNDDTLEIVIDLLTQDAVKVKVGDPILITGWGEDRVMSARVSSIEPQAFTKISALGVEEQRVNVIAEFLESPQPLGAGYRIEAGIVVWEEDNILTVPTSAIFQRTDTWQTYVVVDEKIELRSLMLGQRGREYAQVIDGLSTGDTVVLYPSELIEEGIEVSF